MSRPRNARSHPPDGEDLSQADRGIRLLLVDCTWRRLPKLVTAYPRRSKLTPDPEHGLASVEALYAAMALLDGPRPELLAANPEIPR